MLSFGKSSICAALCVAILFVAISRPGSQDSAKASTMKAEVSAIESLAQTLAKSIEQQQMMNVKATEADLALVDKINSLFSHVSQLQGHVGELRESVRLTSTAVQDDGCTCGDKLADLQRQIDELKAKVASLEQSKTTSTTAAAASSYGSPAKVASSSGGSAGALPRVASGGSAGSVGYGSTGGSSVVYSQPVASTPVASVSVVRSSSTGHWTYPGSIDTHLAGTHGVNTAGMTREQMLDLHDALHEGRTSGPLPIATFAPVRQRSVTRSVFSAPATTSNCPGGVCPAPSSRRSSGGLLGFGILRR